MSPIESEYLKIESWDINKSKPIDIPNNGAKNKYVHLVKNSKDVWVKILDVSCDLYQGSICKTPENNYYNKGDKFIFHREHIYSLRNTLISK